MIRSFLPVLAASVFVLVGQPAIAVDGTDKEPAKVSEAKINALVEKGIAYLKTAQADDGSFSGYSGTGVTALVLAGMLRNGIPASNATMGVPLASASRPISGMLSSVEGKTNRSQAE